MATKGYRLKIKRLDFISAVDAGAQGPIANVALIKRATKKGESPTIQKATCKVFKLDDKLGLVFGWAMAGTLDGGQTPHIDHQDDAIDVTGDDFIKACAEFMEAGAASDVMHDGKQDGRIVFAMPLVKGVNEALGITSNVEGFAIAMKPSPETFKRFVSGELAAFSIGGIGDREPLASTKRKTVAKHLFARVVKEAVLTSEVDGHQHAIDLDDPANMWCDLYQTSYQTMEGAEQGHSHAWNFDPDTGVITIAADSGHTHAVDAVVPPDALAAWAKLDAEQDARNAAIAAAPVEVTDDPSDGIPSALPVEESSGATINVNILARARGGNSTPSKPVRTVKAHPEKPMPNEQDAKIADLTTKTAELSKRNGALSRMSAVAFAVFKTLSGADADAFLEKTTAEQDAAAADLAKRNEDGDKVVYLSKSTGDVYKAKDDPRLVEMAKRMDAQAESIEKADIRKQATELLGGMPGDDATHDLIVSALRKSGAKTEELEKAYATLKGMKATSALGKNAPGINGGGGGATTATDALAALEAGLAEFGKAQNITKGLWTDGMAAFVQTEKGAALKRAYDESLS